MSFADTLLPEFDNEMKITRSLLENVPFDHLGTKPGQMSRTLIELASHIANITRFGTLIAGSDEVDFAKSGRPPATYANAEEMLGVFDTNVKASRAAIQGVDESKLGDTWTLRSGDHVIMAMPRAAAFRGLLMSHVIHHRGQLSAYFRLNDVPHPPIYGPTAEMMPPK